MDCTSADVCRVVQVMSIVTMNAKGHELLWQTSLRCAGYEHLQGKKVLIWIDSMQAAWTGKSSGRSGNRLNRANKASTV